MKEITFDKTWGKEIWFVNNPIYCGKVIIIEKGKWSSEGRFHYHKVKDETFYVIQGKLKLDYVTMENEFFSCILVAGQAFRVKPNMKHRFTAISEEGCSFIEVSTTHRDSDSYRCEWDKENREWIEE